MPRQRMCIPVLLSIAVVMATMQAAIAVDPPRTVGEVLDGTLHDSAAWTNPEPAARGGAR